MAGRDNLKGLFSYTTDQVRPLPRRKNPCYKERRYASEAQNEGAGLSLHSRSDALVGLHRFVSAVGSPSTWPCFTPASPGSVVRTLTNRSTGRRSDGPRPLGLFLPRCAAG
jgi:hypothetical protein